VFGTYQDASNIMRNETMSESLSMANTTVSSSNVAVIVSVEIGRSAM
jgi:hypothetical protein